MHHFLAGVILKKYNLLREGHFMAILWHESSAGGVQGWTDFVWSWKIGSGLAQIVWSWKIGSGLSTNRLELDDWDFWFVCDFFTPQNP